MVVRQVCQRTWNLPELIIYDDKRLSMLIEEIVEIIEFMDFEDELDEKQVWARRGNKVVRKTRCMSGPRKGRVVSSPSQCNKPKDVKKSQVMKKTKAQKGYRMAKKARKTKRLNPVSKRLGKMNK